MKNIAVVLVGSGHIDGSEITEAVSTLIALSKYNAKIHCFSLNMEQKDVFDHLVKEKVKSQRNLLVEAARIARGNIKDLKLLKVKDFDAVIFPGGLGVAKNLFDYAYKGRECEINSLVQEKIIEFHKLKKYIGAICISPLLIARAFKGSEISPNITLGNAKEPAQDAEFLGATHSNKLVSEICLDKENKIVSTPAYMHGSSTFFEVYDGIEKLVKYIVEYC